MPTFNSDALELGPANFYFDNRFLGYLGDRTQISVSTTASPLTGAQAGSSPLNKVVTGGTVRFTVELKEITLENIAIAIPNSVLVGSLLTVKNRVGFLMRSIAKELKVIKILGGVESADPEDIFVAPEVSPVESEITFPFSPTEQRVLSATFEAWPDDTTGEWFHVGA